ncbi:MAG: ATP-binding protein [Nocardioidaceae bacterium]
MGPTGRHADDADTELVRTLSGQGRALADLSQELTWALAEEPRLVVCDLTGMPVSASESVELIAPVIPYLYDWPGTGLVVVTGRGSDARTGLLAQPHPPTLVVSETRDAGIDELQARLPTLGRQALHLTAQLTAPRAARLFTARALLGWRLAPLVGPASLVVSELVTNAVVHAASPMDLTLSKADGRLQMTVRDHGAGFPKARFEASRGPDLGGRGLLLVQATARGWGVFPGRADGKTVWAVFDTA